MLPLRALVLVSLVPCLMGTTFSCPGASPANSLPGTEDCSPPKCTAAIVAVNRLLPHKNPQMFYQCGPGLNYYEMPCGPGTCFSPQYQMCVHPYQWKNPCREDGGPPTTTTAPVEPEISSTDPLPQSTTSEPATEPPITSGPTTEEPTTDGAVTENPVTEAPVTEETTTDGPVTEEPTTEEVTTEIITESPTESPIDTTTAESGQSTTQEPVTITIPTTITVDTTTQEPEMSTPTMEPESSTTEVPAEPSTTTEPEITTYPTDTTSEPEVTTEGANYTTTETSEETSSTSESYESSTTEETSWETPTTTIFTTTTKRLFTGNVCPGVDISTVEPGTHECKAPKCTKNGERHPHSDPRYFNECVQSGAYRRVLCQPKPCFNASTGTCVDAEDWVNACIG